jgi:deazaflavin-dependent oxidoreductase (nitroreductase family)
MAGNRWGPLDAAFPRWVAACVLGETIGMTAAALAARAPDALGIGATGTGPTIALVFVVAGGLIEGLALGILQALVLRRFMPRVRYLRWAVVTTVVAGVGWAVASAPAALSTSTSDDQGPPLGVIVLGAAALGAVMGAVLGASQALVLRGAVLRPWRWVWISVLGWCPAMVVIFLGATAPGADWPLLAVVALGTATGIVAGAVLGLTTGALLPVLDATSVADRLALGVLRSPLHRLADRSLIGLRVRGLRSAAVFELPVMYVREGTQLLVFVGHSRAKRWWKNIQAATPVEVLVGGRWRSATARLLREGEPDRERTGATYFRRVPAARRMVSAADPMVTLDLT